MKISRIVVWVFVILPCALIMAAISIPNLLRSRIAANEASATAQLHSLTESIKHGATVAAAGPMLVRGAVLTIVSNEFENGQARMEEVCRRHQGHVASLAVSHEGNGGRTLAAMLRIPTDRLDAAMLELRKLGRVTRETQNTEEITQQYVDLVARLNNARSTEQRLVQVLQQRTGKVSDVLEVEKEIGRVRGEIEHMEIQRRTFDHQVTFASVELHLMEEAKKTLETAPPSTGTALWNAMVDGFREAADQGVDSLTLVLHYGPTLLFWTALLFWPVRRGWRRLRASL